MSKKKSTDEDKKITNENPVSLDPLDFDEVMDGLLVIPLPKEPKGQERTQAKKPKPKTKKKPS